MDLSLPGMWKSVLEEEIPLAWQQSFTLNLQSSYEQQVLNSVVVLIQSAVTDVVLITQVSRPPEPL